MILRLGGHTVAHVPTHRIAGINEHRHYIRIPTPSMDSYFIDGEPVTKAEALAMVARLQVAYREAVT